MEPEQYDILSSAEETHWWYAGLRDVMDRCLKHASMRLPPHPNILDAGCGTGGNLRFLNDLLAPKYLGGFDISPKALRYASMKNPQADLYPSDICNPEIRCDRLDLIVSCDVLYVTGEREAISGLQRLCASLKSGGLFLWNLPAYNWLASYHDRAVHTRQRFYLSGLRRLANQLELDCIRISYRLCWLLPLILTKRLVTSLLIGGAVPVSDLLQPNRWLNRTLFRYLQWENRRIANGWSYPCGSSIFMVCKKR
jgi:SAM-dependent methyltransferase